MKLEYGTFIDPLDVVAAILVVGAILLAFWSPGFANGRFQQVERWLSRLAHRPRVAIAVSGLLPVVLRLALLPVYPPPEPWTHDEFCFLLQADTFASGRITNPPHPYWTHFESIYILSQPTYTAKYQPGTGLVLAVGKLAGSEWSAVVASMGILCALLCWMLQAWLPASWAFLGAILAGLQFGVLSYWMNSYWGGTVAAIGGTLVLGALPRIFHKAAKFYGVVIGFGLAIVLNVRPLEGLLLGVVILLVVLHRRLWNIFLPASLVLIPCFAVMTYYNYRVTGDALKPPYSLHIETYGTPQGFFWQPPFQVAGFRFPEIRDEYLRQRELHARRSSPVSLAKATLGKLRVWWTFYVGVVFTIPLLFLAGRARPDSVRLALWILLPFAFFHLTFHAYYPHYSAPVAGLFLLLVVEGWRRLWVWRPGGQPAGKTIARLLPVASVLLLTILVAGKIAEKHLPRSISKLLAEQFSGPTHRERFQRNLEELGGQHLVFVRYRQPGHHPDEEWVYNRADIDQADVVWARLWTEESNRQLKKYFADRRIWIAEPDARPPRLTEIQATRNGSDTP